MFVDSLKPTEIVVSFSALSRWNDPPPPPAKEESKTNLKGGKGDKSSDRDSKAEQLTAESSSVIEGKLLLWPNFRIWVIWLIDLLLYYFNYNFEML